MKNKKIVRDLSYMIDRVKFNGDYSKLNKSEKKVLETLFSTPQYKLPQLVKDYITAYSREVGYCGEVAASAISEYIKNEGYSIDNYLYCIFHPTRKYIEFDDCEYYKDKRCKKEKCRFIKSKI